MHATLASPPPQLPQMPQPRQANAPVRVLAPRESAATLQAQRPAARVLQAGRAPAQLSLLLRPPSARR